MEVHIYIGTDSKAPRVQPRKYGYVLACTLKGKLATKQGFKETTGTYNRATLEAITEAVARVVKPSEIQKMLFEIDEILEKFDYKNIKNKITNFNPLFEEIIFAHKNLEPKMFTT